MNQAATAYSRTAQAVTSPRQIEAQALMKAATRLQAIRDDWSGQAGDLGEALDFNRKLWTLLATGATDSDNAIPADTKQGVSRLAAFVFTHTFSIIAEPEARKLGILVSINREIAAGLRGLPQAA